MVLNTGHYLSGDDVVFEIGGAGIVCGEAVEIWHRIIVFWRLFIWIKDTDNPCNSKGFRDKWYNFCADRHTYPSWKPQPQNITPFLPADGQFAHSYWDIGVEVSALLKENGVRSCTPQLDSFTNPDHLNRFIYQVSQVGNSIYLVLKIFFQKCPR